MELNDREADEPLVETQIAVTEKEHNSEKKQQKQNEKSKTQTLKTVPIKTLGTINAVTINRQAT